MPSHRYRSQIIQEETDLPQPYDVWPLHKYEPIYRRELPTAKALCTYALSPSTKQVGYALGTTSVPAEFRVWGPGDRVVWYPVQIPVPSLADRKLLTELAHTLHADGKLVEA